MRRVSLDPDPAAPPFEPHHAALRAQIRRWVDERVRPFAAEWERREFPRSLYRYLTSVSGPLPATSAARLRAALRSLHMVSPQASQAKVRSVRVSLVFTTPHAEHVLLDGYQRPATTSRPPCQPAL